MTGEESGRIHFVCVAQMFDDVKRNDWTARSDETDVIILIQLQAILIG
jgi:hypothetical protein